ncbi:hypothetical protein MHYP_G00243940 [Metynnis hypsauchen]
MIQAVSYVAPWITGQGTALNHLGGGQVHPTLLSLSIRPPTIQPLTQVRSKGEPETNAPPEVALSEWVYLKVIKRKWCEPR